MPARGDGAREPPLARSHRRHSERAGESSPELRIPGSPSATDRTVVANCFRSNGEPIDDLFGIDGCRRQKCRGCAHSDQSRRLDLAQKSLFGFGEPNGPFPASCPAGPRLAQLQSSDDSTRA